MKLFFLMLLLCVLVIAQISAQTIDETFVDPVPYRPAKINTIKVLPDNKVLLGGEISFFKSTRVNNLIRLNSDNSLDETFVFNADPKYIIRKIGFQSTGNIIVLAYVEDPLYDNTPEFYSLFKISPNGELLKEFKRLYNVNSFAVQNDDKILICGGSTNFNVNYLNRLNDDLTSDPTFKNQISFDKMVTDVNIFGNKIYVSGLFSKVNGSPKNNIVKLNLDGTVDNTFDVGNGTNENLFSTSVQPDGKLLLGYNFLSKSDNIVSNGMVRLNTDGTIDPTFSTEYANNFQSAIAIKDSSIFIDCWENSCAGYVLLKLKYDGSLDNTFKPVRINMFCSDYEIGIRGNEVIFNNCSVADNKYGISMCDSIGNHIDSKELEVKRYGNFSTGDFLNDKLIVSGDFVKVNEVETSGIALLDKNGTVDKSFILPEDLGKVLQFQIFNDTTVFVCTGKALLKLNEKGKVLMNIDFVNNKRIIQIRKFKVQEDGKIIAANDWGIYKFHAEGNEDTTFNTGSGIDINAFPLDFDFQDNKIIWGSYFNVYNGKTVNKLVRLNQDASIDTSFNIGTGPDNMVTSIKVLDSGEIIVAGVFLKFNQVSVPSGIVKISRNGELDLQFNENQKLYSQRNNVQPYRKIIQQDSLIYVQVNSVSVIAMTIDGKVQNNFSFPLVTKSINDVITLTDSIKKNEFNLKSASIKKCNKYMFALGDLKKTKNNEPSFIVKLLLGNNSSTTGLIGKPETNEVEIYPLPVTDRLKISIQKPANQSNVVIYSMNGTIIYSSKINNRIFEIDMSKYVSGIYIVKIQAAGKDVAIKKIIKQ